MADLILDGRARLVDIDLFRLSRFAEGDLIAATHTYQAASLG